MEGMQPNGISVSNAICLFLLSIYCAFLPIQYDGTFQIPLNGYENQKYLKELVIRVLCQI